MAASTKLEFINLQKLQNLWEFQQNWKVNPRDVWDLARFEPFKKLKKKGELAMYTRGISRDLAIEPFEKELKKREIELMKPI